MFSDIQPYHLFNVFQKRFPESVHTIYFLNCSDHSAEWNLYLGFFFFFPLLCKNLIFNQVYFLFPFPCLSLFLFVCLFNFTFAFGFQYLHVYTEVLIYFSYIVKNLMSIFL